MPQPTRRRRESKPAKPYDDFPLFAHPNGQWAKKIRGKPFYYGLWAEHEAAAANYLKYREYDQNNLPRPVEFEGLTVRGLVNQFLTAKRHLVDTQELSARSFADYHDTCDRILAAFGGGRLVDGLTTTDFATLRASIAKRWGPVALGNEVNRVRVVFNFAVDADLTLRPIRFGPDFKRPSRETLRRAKREKGSKFLEAKQIKALLAVATVPMKAMILLGVNCGLGNSDIAGLPNKAIDLKRGWLDHPRPKTEIDRRVPLWPETVTALEAAIKSRPTPTNTGDERLAFITTHGRPWVRFNLTESAEGESIERQLSKPKGVPIDSIALEFGKLLKRLDMKRLGLGFYALRHVFETVAGESKDQIAVEHVMGHAAKSDDMSAVCRERISDERLKTVTDTVRKWLFETGKKGK